MNLTNRHCLHHFRSEKSPCYLWRSFSEPQLQALVWLLLMPKLLEAGERQKYNVYVCMFKFTIYQIRVVFYLSSVEGAARLFYQLTLPWGISLSEEPYNFKLENGPSLIMTVMTFSSILINKGKGRKKEGEGKKKWVRDEKNICGEAKRIFSTNDQCYVLETNCSTFKKWEEGKKKRERGRKKREERGRKICTGKER